MPLKYHLDVTFLKRQHRPRSFSEPLPANPNYDKNTPSFGRLSINLVLWDQLAWKKFKMVPKLGEKPAERKKRKSNGKVTLKVKFLFPINCAWRTFQTKKTDSEEQTDLHPLAFSEAWALRGNDEWMGDGRVWNAAGPAGNQTSSSYP